MFNVIGFKDGSMMWISDNEKTLVNHALLNGERFVEILRLKKTYNTDMFYYVGIPSGVFTAKEVADLEPDAFSFTVKNLCAVDKEGKYWKMELGSGIWDICNKADFERGSDFDGFIKSNS